MERNQSDNIILIIYYTAIKYEKHGLGQSETWFEVKMKTVFNEPTCII